MGRALRFPLEMAVLPAAFLTVGGLFRLLLAFAPRAIATDLAAPLPVATAWHGYGNLFWIAAAACIFAAAIPYARFVQALFRSDAAPGLPFILILCAASLLCALTIPVVFSSDVYAYAAYGWMDAHGINPYAHLPLATQDPLIRDAIWQWSNPLPACVYGPLFVWIAKICVIAGAGGGVAMQLLLFRLVASAALVACGALSYAALAGRSRGQRLAAAAGIALNPVVIWAAAEGHNDTLMLAVVLLGFVAIRRYGYAAGALIITASALVKASGVGAAVALAIFSWPKTRRFLRVAAGIAGGLLLTAIVARPFESGMRTVLLPHGHYAPQFSAQFAVWQFVQGLLGFHVHSLELGVTLALVAAGALGLYGIRRALRGEMDGFAFMSMALWLAIPNPYPWYALWILPAAFLCLRASVAWALVAASITIFVRYLPDVSATTNVDFNLLITFCELSLPLAILAARARVIPAEPAFEAE